MSGFGTCTIGQTPFGYGDPTEVSAPIDNLQADTARYLNPLTKDWQIDSDTGEYARMPAIRQRVLLALTTIKGSAMGLPDFGVELPKVMDAAFDRRVAASVRLALYQLSDVEKVIRIDGVEVERTTIRATVTVSYTDLTTGQPDSVSTTAS